MSELLLVAASGLAREVLAALEAVGGDDVAGVLDDNPARHGERIGTTTVLGGVDLIGDHPDAQVVLCVGGSASRAALAGRLDLPDERYATVVHPSVHIPTSCIVGAGSILLAGCVLTASVTVGRHVVAMPNVVLTHDDIVEDAATLCAGVVVGGGVRIGARAYIGMSAGIRENLTIGSDATIGMGAVVLHHVPDGQTWFGTPAARYRPTSDILIERHPA